MNWALASGGSNRRRASAGEYLEVNHTLWTDREELADK